MSKSPIKGERLHQILIAPVVSEKGTRVADKHNQSIFRVRRDARKDEIKQAVETLFKVKVESVQTLVVKGKVRGMGRIKGRTSNWKKAYVRLAEGQEIDFTAHLGG